MIVVVTHFLPELHVCTYMCTMYLYMYMYTNLHALVHTKELETKKNWLASTRLFLYSQIIATTVQGRSMHATPVNLTARKN